MSIGIYKITNKKNGKNYVGSSANLEKRYQYHLRDLRNNKHFNIHLQRSFNLDGEESFEFSVIEKCSEDVLTSREEYLIEHLNSLNTRYGYNINPKCDRPPSWSGKTHTEATKLKMSKSQEGKICSQHSKDVASLTHKGKKISEGQIHFLREKNKGEGNAMFGKTPYDVWVEKYGKEIADQKYSEWKKKHDDNMPRGDNHSSKRPEVRIKIGNAHRNKVVSEETKEKIRKLKTGLKYSDQTKKLQSDKRKGELNPACKIKNSEIPKILKLLNTISAIKVAKMYNVSKRTIYNIKNGIRKI